MGIGVLLAWPSLDFPCFRCRHSCLSYLSVAVQLGCRRLVMEGCWVMNHLPQFRTVLLSVLVCCVWRLASSDARLNHFGSPAVSFEPLLFQGSVTLLCSACRRDTSVSEAIWPIPTDPMLTSRDPSSSNGAGKQPSDEQKQARNAAGQGATTADQPLTQQVQQLLTRGCSENLTILAVAMKTG